MSRNGMRIIYRRDSIELLLWLLHGLFFGCLGHGLGRMGKIERVVRLGCLEILFLRCIFIQVATFSLAWFYLDWIERIQDSWARIFPNLDGFREIALEFIS